MMAMSSVLYAHPLILIPMELFDSQHRAPFPELVDPVVQGGLGHNDHVWP